MSARKPTWQKVAEGNPGRRPLNADEPTPARGRPACPSHITGEAREEWDRITDELDQMGVLSTIDRTGLAMYCRQWARWVEAEKLVEEGGLLIPAPKSGTPMQNYYLSIANSAYDRLAKMLTEYGLTPASRTKIKVQPQNETSNGLDLS